MTRLSAIIPMDGYWWIYGYYKDNGRLYSTCWSCFGITLEFFNHFYPQR